MKKNLKKGGVIKVVRLPKELRDATLLQAVNPALVMMTHKRTPILDQPTQGAVNTRIRLGERASDCLELLREDTGASIKNIIITALQVAKTRPEIARLEV